MPILTTALAAALARVLITAGGGLGHDFEHPMAVAILGRLTTSTVLNLGFQPAPRLRSASRRS